MSEKKGRVVAVCSSATGGVPKHPHESIAVGMQGVEGDYHAGPINKHKKGGDPQPNSRQVTLVAQEMLDVLNSRLGISLKAGDLGENVLVAGLGDLSQLQRGDRLLLGSRVVLKVTAQNSPCDVIGVYHPGLVKEIIGKRGVTAVVVSAGTVSQGDTCRAVVGSLDRRIRKGIHPILQGLRRGLRLLHLHVWP